MCSFLSLGAADTAIRSTLRLTTDRQLYNKKVFDLSHPKRVLVNGFADILICDCVAISAARGLHVVPEQFSIWSAITKAFVMKTIEKVMEEISGNKYRSRTSRGQYNITMYCLPKFLP